MKSPEARGINSQALLPVPCICHRRNVEYIFCRRCIWISKVGQERRFQRQRLRRTCPAHPHKIFPTDIARCPRCSASAASMKEVTYR